MIRTEIRITNEYELTKNIYFLGILIHTTNLKMSNKGFHVGKSVSQFIKPI